MTVSFACPAIAANNDCKPASVLNISDLKNRFPAPKKEVKQSPIIDLSKLNPLKTKIKPAKDVEINLFSSLEDLLSVSIIGIFGLVGISGTYALRKALKAKKYPKIRT